MYRVISRLKKPPFGENQQEDATGNEWSSFTAALISLETINLQRCQDRPMPHDLIIQHNDNGSWEDAFRFDEDAHIRRCVDSMVVI